MVDANYSQHKDPQLARNIWQRHVVAPGMIQRKPMLNILQRNHTWMLSRSQFSGDIQRRWLPTSTGMDSGGGLNLPFVRSVAQVEKWMSRAAEMTPALVEKSVVQENISPASATELSQRTEGSVASQSLSQAPALTISRAASAPVSDRTATSQDSNAISPSAQIQNPIPTEHPSTMGGAINAVQRHAEITVSRMAESVARSAHVPNQQERPELSGERLIQRSGDATQERSTQTAATPQMDTRSQPDYPLSASAMTFAPATFQPISERLLSPMTVARSIYVSSADTKAIESPQALASEIHSVPSTSFPPLIQRQTQPAETVTTPSVTVPAAPVSSRPAAESRATAGAALDIEKISEDIIHIIMDRMAVERERRGIGL